MIDGLGPGFTLLAGDAACRGEFAAAAAKLGIPQTDADLPQAWQGAYGTDRILLRPDRFVAWAGESVGTPGEILAHSVGGV